MTLHTLLGRFIFWLSLLAVCNLFIYAVLMQSGLNQTRSSPRSPGNLVGDDNTVSWNLRNTPLYAETEKYDQGKLAADNVIPPWDDVLEDAHYPVNEIKSLSNNHISEDLTLAILWKAGLLKGTSDDGLAKSRQRLSYNLTIYSLNYDAGPVQAIRHLLEPWGIKFIDQSFSRHCRLTDTCIRHLQVINHANAFELPETAITHFYELYKDDIEFKQVDVFLCISPAAICELFLPFNRTMILLIDSRYEAGRSSLSRWKKWNHSIKVILENPKNILATTNMYDAEYIRRFMQVFPVILPYSCDYLSHYHYKPVHKEFFLYPIHGSGFRKQFLKDFRIENVKGHYNVTLNMGESLFSGNGSMPQDLVKHQGVILIPDDVSSLRMTEIYRLNIPLFVPTVQLLTRWQKYGGVVWKRVLASSHSPRSQGSVLATEGQLPDPNNDQDSLALSHWLQFLDIYINPYTIPFMNMEDLLMKLESYSYSNKLFKLSQDIENVNQHKKQSIILKWKTLLNNIVR